MRGSLEVEIVIETRREQEATRRLKQELSTLARAREEEAALASERRSVLRGIKEAQLEFHQAILAERRSAEAGAEFLQTSRKLAQLARSLRCSLQRMGDEQADLADEEAAERAGRRRLREEVRERLEHEEAQHGVLQRRLASGVAELAVLRDRLDAFKEKEHRELEGANKLKKLAQHFEEVEEVEERQHTRERQEIAVAEERLHQELQELAVAEEDLHRELAAAQERLLWEEQRQRERLR